MYNPTKSSFKCQKNKKIGNPRKFLIVGAIHELPLLRIIRVTCPELVEGFVVQISIQSLRQAQDRHLRFAICNFHFAISLVSTRILSTGSLRLRFLRLRSGQAGQAGQVGPTQRSAPTFISRLWSLGFAH